MLGSGLWNLESEIAFCGAVGRRRGRVHNLGLDPCLGRGYVPDDDDV